jgi:hypothetical protein
MPAAAHVIHQRKSTEAKKLAWCTAQVFGHEWAYQGVDHVAIALDTNDTPAPPCLDCLLAIALVLKRG